MPRSTSPAPHQDPDIALLLRAIKEKTADARVSVERRYVIWREGETNPPFVVISLNDAHEPVGDDNYLVDAAGDEWPLSVDDEYAIAKAITATTNAA